MTDWLMVIITAVYVAATIVICVFNGKSAKAAKEQTETARQQIDEMIRQYNESNRPIVIVRFEIIRSGLLCFVLENIGPVVAEDIKIRINDEVIDNLEKEDKQISAADCIFISQHDPFNGDCGLPSYVSGTDHRRYEDVRRNLKRDGVVRGRIAG